MKPEIYNIIRELFLSQNYAVLATVNERAPHTNIVAFCADQDLETIILATPRDTTKFKNIQANPAVSLFIDSRTNSVSDINSAIGVTVLGKAYECSLEIEPELITRYQKKYPHLKDFLDSPGCALIKLNVARYIIVQNFQETIVVDMG